MYSLHTPNKIKITIVLNCKINTMLNSKLSISNANDASDPSLSLKPGSLN